MKNLKSFRTNRPHPTHAIRSRHLVDELTDSTIYLSISSVASKPWLMCTISVFSWTTAAFQHQRQDQGARHPPAQDQWPVSTNLFSFVVSPSSPSLLPCPARTSLASPLTHRYSVFRSPFIPCLCLLHIPHGPLFPVRDPLRRVSPGQVLETRGFHRKSILRPFYSSFLRFSSSLAGSPRLLVLPSFGFSFVSRSRCHAKRHAFSFRMSFNSVNERKCEEKMMLRTGNTRRRDYKKAQFVYLLPYRVSRHGIL